MRKSLSALLLATTSFAAVSASDDDHYYAGFEAGLSHSVAADFTNSRDNFELEAQKNIGPSLGIYFGKKTGKYRYELEYAFYRNYFDDFVQENASVHTALTGTFPAGGKQKTQTLMLNGYREFEAGENWKFLAGLGLGMAHIGLDHVRTGQNEIVNDRSWTPAAQLMAQFVRPFGSGLEFGLGFKMMRSTKADFNTRLGRMDYRGKQDTVFARLSWRFGAGSEPRREPEPVVRAPAPAPQPVAAPAPVQPKPAPVVQEPKPLPPLPEPYIVYFDFDSAEITNQAAAIIRSAVRGYRNFKAVSIEASGHTDRAGSSTYNEQLAQRRVIAVRDALVAQGIPEDKIEISAEGEDKQRVSTEDGVRNDQNRRVEIKLLR